MSRSIRVICITLTLGLVLSAGSPPETWQELLSTADSLSKAGRPDSAAVVGRRALQAARDSYGAEHPSAALVLHRLGVYYFNMSKLDTAESYWLEALSIREKVLDPDDLDISKTLTNLGLIRRDRGDYENARVYYERSLAIKERVLGPEDPGLSQVIRNLGNLYVRLGDYDEAEVYLKRALELRKKKHGEDDPAVLRIHTDIADVYQEIGRPRDAIRIYDRVIATIIRQKGPDAPELLTYYNSLAVACWKAYDYLLAEEMYKQVLTGCERSKYRDDALYAQALSNLGLLYSDMGNYVESERLLRRALEMREAIFRQANPEVAETKFNLGYLCYLEGRVRDADSYFTEVLDMISRFVSQEHEKVSDVLNGLAFIRMQQGRTDIAKEYFERSLEIRRKLFGEEDSHVGEALSNLGIALIQMGALEEAEQRLDAALTIKEKTLRAKHPSIAGTLLELARLYLLEGRFDEAEPVLGRALEIRERCFGSDHQKVAGVLEQLCILSRFRGQHQRALDLAERALRIVKNSFDANAVGLTETDALAFSTYARNAFNLFLSSYVEMQPVDPVAEKACAQFIINNKGQVSEAIFDRQRLLSCVRDSLTYNAYQRFQATKMQLAGLYVAGPRDDPSYQSLVDSLQRSGDDLEAELSLITGEDISQGGAIQLRDIISHILREEVLVEYVKFGYQQLNPEDPQPRYLGLCIDHNGNIKLQDLGQAAPIDTLISRYRAHMLRIAAQGHAPVRGDGIEYERICTDLYKAVLKPLETAFEGKKVIVIAPDGGLNLVSFAGLINDEGGYLIEEAAVHYLTAARDIVRFDRNAEVGRGLLAVGDPDYDAVGGAPPRIASAEPETSFFIRGPNYGVSDFKDMHLKRLPHTRIEVERIIQEWSRRNESVIALLDEDATEDEFKSNAPGHRIIHLATHGYFFEPRDTESSSTTELETKIGQYRVHPLLCSGLFLAGANGMKDRADRTDPNDGVLTAYEVSGLNLHGTEMVVLSACETGLGTVEVGEGVYGLRRAFQLAGARTVVSALWPVSDEMTSEMMSQLYTSSKKSLPERFRKMQLAQIKKLRESGLSDHPYSWAGFIAMGDWK